MDSSANDYFQGLVDSFAFGCVIVQLQSRSSDRAVVYAQNNTSAEKWVSARLPFVDEEARTVLMAEGKAHTVHSENDDAS